MEYKMKGKEGKTICFPPLIIFDSLEESMRKDRSDVAEVLREYRIRKEKKSVQKI
jgi:hypothetical protein